MDNDGRLYVVSEAGGGDTDHPQLWVYAPVDGAEPGADRGRVHQPDRVAGREHEHGDARQDRRRVRSTDDGIGTNALSVSGPDASAFEVDGQRLYLKAGTVAEPKTSYTV